eukprot:snap_masked-scaffold_48-processed-gene-1.77-mRNA-1 protein AED:1.00 eAED:1.00 QI:0/0/0/0/1/1/2/0/101
MEFIFLVKKGQLPRLYIPGAKTMLRANCLLTFLVRMLQESMSLYLVSLASHLSRLDSTCSCAIPVELKTAPKYFISFTDRLLLVVLILVQLLVAASSGLYI